MHARMFSAPLLLCSLATVVACGDSGHARRQSSDASPDGSAGDTARDGGGPSSTPPDADTNVLPPAPDDGGLANPGSDAGSSGGSQDPAPDGGQEVMADAGGTGDAGATSCPDGQSRYRPGCGSAQSGVRQLPEAGCYAECSGSDDTSCAEGTVCQKTWIDPCVCPSSVGCCAACGAETWLCLEEGSQTTSGRSPYDGRCARTRGDSCETDADCTTGGCGGALCYNPDGGAPPITTCDCTAPPASCGCVDGACRWYE